MKQGGNSACVLNAANEVVVDAFLKDKIGFLEMSDVIEKCLIQVPFISKPTYENYVESDKASRELAASLIF
jgi:1-deoxy-D-xylulose-5-phosphate reductoisomerase